MPCNDGGPTWEDIAHSNAKDIAKLKERLDKVVSLFCEAGMILHNTGGYNLLSDECKEFLTEHYNYDKIRIQREIEQTKHKLAKLEIELRNVPEGK